MKGKTISGICPGHGYWKGDRCQKCEAEMKEKDYNFAAIVFKPMWYEDICEVPIYIESKRQLKEECKKHGVVAVRLL